ncbi:MAG: MATE family efflux transporter [Breznakibacter sp.]
MSGFGILRLALPNIVTNLTVPLLSMVDLHLMGYLNSEVYMGAVAMGNVIFNFVYWGFAFLRMSMSGMVAQAFGSNNISGSAEIFWRGLMLVALGSLLLIILQVPIVKFSMLLMEGNPDVKQLAGQYFHIRIWSAPATIAQMVFFGWFLGMQNAFVPMLVSVTVNVVNIACSFLLVRVVGLDIAGVAWASVVAHYVGLLLCIWFLKTRFAFVVSHINIRRLWHMDGYGKLLHVSGDIFVRTLCVIAVFTFFTSQSAGMGNTVLAANSVLVQFLLFFAYFLDGFAYAAEAVVGRLVGRGSYLQLKRAVKQLFIWGGLFAVVFTFLYLLLADKLMRILTNNPAVVVEAANYFVWVAFVPLASFMSFIWDGVYIGSTASKAMRNTMLFATVFFFFLPFVALRATLGNHAIWLAMVLFFLMRGVAQTWLAPRAVFGKK